MQWDGISAAPRVVNEKLCAVEVTCLDIETAIDFDTLSLVQIIGRARPFQTSGLAVSYRNPGGQ